MPPSNEEMKAQEMVRSDYAWVKEAVMGARAAFVQNLDQEQFVEEVLEPVEGPQDDLTRAVDTYPVDLQGDFDQVLMDRIIAFYPRR
jgi:hypothetical protein